VFASLPCGTRCASRRPSAWVRAEGAEKCRGAPEHIGRQRGSIRAEHLGRALGHLAWSNCNRRSISLSTLSDVAGLGSKPIETQTMLYESMDYDLAKQLKDAGLPQQGLGFFAAQDRVVGSRQHSDTFDAYVPSLSELIGACGDSFAWLVRQADTAGGVRWLACSKGFQPISGATAVEAVARLWLASGEPKPPS
jgi:hypothetical protein